MAVIHRRTHLKVSYLNLKYDWIFGQFDVSGRISISKPNGACTDNFRVIPIIHLEIWTLKFSICLHILGNYMSNKRRVDKIGYLYGVTTSVYLLFWNIQHRARKLYRIWASRNYKGHSGTFVGPLANVIRQ